MATETAFWRLDFPVFYKFSAQCKLSFLLFFLGFSFWMPSKVKYMFNRPYVLFWISVTIQAKSHTVGLSVLNFLHLVHSTMTFNAANSTIHMGCVVKINIIGSFVNLDPLNRITSGVTFTNWGELGRITFDNVVATHTGAGRWHVGVLGLRDVSVTEAAIEIKAILSCVPFMIKRYWLLGGIPHSQVFWCGIVSDTRSDDCRQKENSDDDFNRSPVCRSWKNIGHGERSMSDGNEE
jgi:hypothetical protein